MKPPKRLGKHGKLPRLQQSNTRKETQSNLNGVLLFSLCVNAGVVVALVTQRAWTLPSSCLALTKVLETWYWDLVQGPTLISPQRAHLHSFARVLLRTSHIALSYFLPLTPAVTSVFPMVLVFGSGLSWQPTILYVFMSRRLAIANQFVRHAHKSNSQKTFAPTAAANGLQKLALTLIHMAYAGFQFICQMK